MAVLLLNLAVFLASVAATLQNNSTQQTQPCGRYYDVNSGFHFDAKSPNDVTFTQSVLAEVSSRSEMDCGAQCVGVEGCVMFTFQRSGNGALGRCRVYGQVLNQTDIKENSPGAKSYVLDLQGSRRVHNGYSIKSGRCVRVITEPLTYHKATQRCYRLDKGHLLFAKTLGDLQFARDMKHEYGITNIWLGADDLKKEGEFKWTDGTPLPKDSPLWGAGQPDNKSGSQHCTCMWRGRRKLFDCPCYRTAVLTVCQRDV